MKRQYGRGWKSEAVRNEKRYDENAERDAIEGRQQGVLPPFAIIREDTQCLLQELMMKYLKSVIF